MAPAAPLFRLAAFATIPSLLLTAASRLASTPNSNPLTYLNLPASGIFPTRSAASSSSSDRCAAALLSDTTAGGEGESLIFPNARLVNSSAGFIECTGQWLVFEGVPEGWRFGVRGVKVGGSLGLEKGAVVEKVEVGIGYILPDSTFTAIQTDTATVSHPYGSFGAGYAAGPFNLTAEVVPGESRSALATTSCATVAEQPQMVIDLWVSLSHEQIEFDDMQPHAGSVSDVSVGLDVTWERCES
ncbi:hypothetical protein C8A05DRAFT_38389 [Staphylotrichum tortipilum]|uniref:Uncharacterized protein n=1 Tax=Staphylotrichum tortipilum TaxID=2831512 RepID=A0AAN6MDI0_9PEZI|nr:hypothetical protein C8A05DRAFT_38389 [Staphylotrichum longicolle]